MILYKSKEKIKKDIMSLIPEMIGAELRALIQNWRKANGLAIDQHIPTMKFYFTEPIYKTVFVEGRSASGEDRHFLELCLIDEAVFEKPDENMLSLMKDNDVIFWCPLGGTVGYGKILSGNTKLIQDDVDNVIKEKLYNEYY